MTTSIIPRRFAIALLLLLVLCATPARADSQVFELKIADPNTVLTTIRNLYGDEVRAELIRQRLVVVGSARQIDEITRLIEQVDQPPVALRLSLSETPPAEAAAGSIVRTTATVQQLETTEGANIAIDRRRFGERAAAAGWWVEIEQVPVQIDSLMLRVDRDGRGGLLVTYSFTRHEDGQRLVYGNRVRGSEGSWMPLLPRPETAPATTNGKVYSTAQAGQQAQLYLKVDRLDGAR